jgi:spermidine/putrescine transport system substrate-binding protein
MIARLIDEGMLRELNYQNIPNFKDVDPRYVSPYYDAEQKYSVPYMVGVVGILYNTQYVSEDDIGGWDLMWNEKYKGKILQFNNSRDAFGTAMFKDGQSVNDTSEATWRAALEELKKQKPLLQAYVMDEIFNKMETESAWIAAYYAGDFLAMYEENPNLGFYYPEVGTNIFADAMCVPVNSANPELAEMYINFMLEREIAAANAEYIYYSSPLTTVNSDPEYIEYMESVYEGAMDILSPEFPEGYNLEYYHNFSDTDLQMVNSLWEELKIDSGTEDGSLADTGVYITCAVIVAAIAVGFTVRYIIQRRRRRYY